MFINPPVILGKRAKLSAVDYPYIRPVDMNHGQRSMNLLFERMDRVLINDERELVGLTQLWNDIMGGIE